MTVRILIVDDSQTARIVLQRKFPQDLEFEVRTAEDGQAGVEVFEAYRPHLTFLDLTMPRLDGFGALVKIREIDPEARVIVVSADIQPEAQQRVLSAGARAFLKKPSSVEEIRAAIRAYL
jgi:two-component system chemotaxis response regulator CheY